MEENNELIEIDLKSLFNAFVARIKLIVFIVFIFGISAFLFSKFAVTPIYSTYLTMYVNSQRTIVSENISINELNSANSLVNIYVEMIKSSNILSEVARQVELDYTVEEMAEMINASPVNDTPIMQIVVSNPNPVHAVMIADAIADVAPDKIPEFMDGGSVKIIDRPQLPEEPSSPNIPKNTIIGLLLGFIVSCGIVFLIEMLDTRIKSEEDITKMFPDIPVIGIIPEIIVDEEE